MNPLEITLIIIGIIVIIVSSRLVDRSQVTKSQLNRSKAIDEVQFTESELKQIKDKLDVQLTKISEEIIISADDELSRLSNEKIMAVGEYSDQILEKIKRNHEDVIFLYNMLNDKENELKAAVKEIDTSKKKVQDILESKKELVKEQSVKKQAEVKQTGQQMKSPRPKLENSTDSLNKTVNLPSFEDNGANSNTQILALYSKGKSVVEISKLLGLGQGEVKLVIDLFRGRE